MKKINIDAIDFSLSYEGYYWYSDQQKPAVVKGTLDKTIFKALPFVVEANFYCADKKISIAIKNIDGEYHCYCADLSQLELNKNNSQDYIAHDLSSYQIKSYKIYQHWEEVTDSLLANMSTLVPSWSAFIGFNA